jgi:branched-chain amino acid transport system substrate-binding protein
VRQPRAGALDALPWPASSKAPAVNLQGQTGLMRASDHQFQQALVVGVMDRMGTAGREVRRRRLGLRLSGSSGRSAAQAAEMPTTCRMQRP